MKKLFPLAVGALALFAAVSTFAQADRNKAEVFVGYSLHSTDNDFDDRLNSHGANAAVTGNFSRYVGITGDFSYHSKRASFVDGLDNYSARIRTMQYLGGVQIKDNSVDGPTVKPFARALAGLANQNISINGTFGGTTFNETASLNNFAMSVGGGLDVKESKRVDIRVIQAEYNPIFTKAQTFGTTTVEGGRQDNFRLSFGVVFH